MMNDFAEGINGFTKSIHDFANNHNGNGQPINKNGKSSLGNAVLSFRMLVFYSFTLSK